MSEVYAQLPFVFPPRVVRYERVEFTETFRRRFLAMHDHRCAYCGQLANAIDHFIPVVLGGTNDIGNLYPACKQCNSTANARHFETFEEKQRFVLQRRIANGTLPDLILAAVHEYATCTDCGRLYRFGRGTTVFLCPVCTYMDENRPVSTWRRERMDYFLRKEFPDGFLMT